MNAKFHLFTQQDIQSLINYREGEIKLGEKISFLSSDTLSVESLKKGTYKYVLLGIPEDIGVRANFGIGGAHTAWDAFLKTFLNMQDNYFLQGSSVLLLGQFEFLRDENAALDVLRAQVSQLDDLVYPIIKMITAAGKIPIVIGGGHNNCFPIIKGIALAKDKALDVLNIDAHSDLRNPEEGRHSGNGFSTALQQGFLNQYCILGLHQAYVSTFQLHKIQKYQVKAVYYDDLIYTGEDVIKAADELTRDMKLPYGLEIDLDGIADILSSANSPSGFGFDKIRSLIKRQRANLAYLHICEGASKLVNGQTDNKIGKTIAYLVSDLLIKR